MYIYIYINISLSLSLSLSVLYVCMCTALKECCADYGAIRSEQDTDTPLEKRCVVHIGSQS